MDAEYQSGRLHQLCRDCVSGANPPFILCFVMLGLDSASRIFLSVSFLLDSDKGGISENYKSGGERRKEVLPILLVSLGSRQYHSPTVALNSHRSS